MDYRTLREVLLDVERNPASEQTCFLLFVLSSLTSLSLSFVVVRTAAALPAYTPSGSPVGRRVARRCVLNNSVLL